MRSSRARPRSARPAAPWWRDRRTCRSRWLGERPDRAAWDRLVGLFAGAVGRGRLDKVVLARRVDLRSPIEIDVENALRRLAAGAPEGTIYAFVRGGRTFLGATPERLVRTAGRDFETVAIAGSAARGATAAEDAALAAALLASEKEREEHAVVVEMLRESLAPARRDARDGRDAGDPAASRRPAPRDGRPRPAARPGGPARPWPSASTRPRPSAASRAGWRSR